MGRGYPNIISRIYLLSISYISAYRCLFGYWKLEQLRNDSLAPASMDMLWLGQIIEALFESYDI
jgi:hypothetical protein